MTKKEDLWKIVTAFRSKIELCWSEESAYKVPEILQYGSEISGGQCAVTCLVLMDVLREKFPKEQVFLVGGQVQSTTGDVVIRDHGWLQIGSGESAIIIDPTADQAESIAEKIIIGTMEELEKKALRYIEKDIEVDHGESVHPKRFKRYTILKKTWDTRGTQTHEKRGILGHTHDKSGKGDLAPKIDDAIKYVTHNEEAIRRSNNVGCYYCLRIYPASEITPEDFMPTERTAMCPYCCVDAVLPDVSGFVLDNDSLQKLHDHWFGV